METYKQKISHLKALYHLACADNILTKSELIYIENVAERLGVDPAELTKFDPTEPDLELPDREYKIYALFHRLAIIVMIDGEMHERERNYCFSLGIKMGLHPNAVNEIINLLAKKGVNTHPQLVMDIFTKYMN